MPGQVWPRMVHVKHSRASGGVTVTDLSAGVAVVTAQGEGEVRGTVHAHRHLGHGHQGGRHLTQGHPQLLRALKDTLALHTHTLPLLTLR